MNSLEDQIIKWSIMSINRVVSYGSNKSYARQRSQSWNKERFDHLNRKMAETNDIFLVSINLSMYLFQFDRKYLSIYLSQSSRSNLVNTPAASLQSGKTPSPQRKSCIGHSTIRWWNSSLKVWEMWRPLSLLLLPGPLWLGVVVPVRIPCIGQIEILNHFLYLKSLNKVQKMPVKLNYIGILGTI